MRETLMRHLLSILAILLMPCAAMAIPPDELFKQAQQAYEGGRFKESADLYDTVISNGFSSAAIYFNRGNALYRSGLIGQAIASYRRAQYVWPRHPDIRANLSIVSQQTGALHDEDPFWFGLIGHLSRNEWTRIAVSGYWLAGCAAALYFLLRRNRWMLRAAAVGLLLSLLGGAGYFRWSEFERHPEAVIVRSGVQALFAPLDNATPHFALPEGSRVTVRETSGSWLKIEVARQEGWIRSEVCDELSLPES